METSRPPKAAASARRADKFFIDFVFGRGSSEVNAVLPESKAHSHETWKGDNPESLAHITLIASSNFPDCHISAFSILRFLATGNMRLRQRSTSDFRRQASGERRFRDGSGGRRDFTRWRDGHAIVDDWAGVIAPSGRGKIIVGLERPTG